MELFVWRNIGLELPEDWELLQFARDPNEGRCAFADRYRFRMEYSWVYAPKPPDLARLLSDYQSKMRNAEKMTDLQPLEAGGWRGFGGRQKQVFVSRYVRHLPEAACLLELVFIHPEAVLPDLERDVAESLRMQSPGPGLARWRAFGMDLAAPGGWGFERCEVQPARAELSFKAPGKGSSWTFRRMGFVSEWMKGTVEDQLRAMMTPVCEPGSLRFERRSMKGHEIVRLSAPEKAPGALRQGRRICAEAWLCPRDGRIFVFDARNRPADSERWADHLRAGRVLACCPVLAEGRA